MTDLEKAICTSLNTFCFLNIWNEPLSEYRVNIQPVMMSPTSRTGSIIVNDKKISLPTTDEAYYIFGISKSCFRNALDVDPNIWISGTDLCNTYDILLHVFTEKGLMCSHGEVYLMMHENNEAYLMAVSKATLSKLCEHKDSSKIYVTIYKDSDIANKTTLYHYEVPSNDRNGTYRLSILQKLQDLNDPSRIILYVNGYETEVADTAMLTYGDFVDIVHDTNIIGNYVVDLTVSSQYRVFSSVMDKMSKLLVHTPKAINPTNKVITHNTCDFFVRRKYPKQYTNEGLYIQRTADISISQVTHQDYSIPMFIIDAYRDTLQTQDVTIRVIMRQHDKDNVLLRDKNYIDMLYTQDDEKIVDCIMGKIKNAPDFWKAENLEQSTYVNMMFDIPNIITTDNMYTYVEGLGYYHTISLICQRVMTSYVTDLWGGFLTYTKPYLFKGKPIYPVLYHNGQKIHSDDLLVTNSPDTGFSVTFVNGSYNIGDQIDVEMFIDGSKTIGDFTVTDTNRTLVVPYTEYVIYRETDISPMTVPGIDKKFTTGYEKIKSLTGIANVTVDTVANKTTFVFGVNEIGKTYIVQNKYCVYAFKHDDIIRSQIQNGSTIVLDVASVSTTGRMLPIFEPQSIQLFLNGKYLIKDLDYCVADMKYGDNITMMKQIVIQNKSYLGDGITDRLETIITAAEIEDSAFGFVKNSQIIHKENKKLALWFPNISTCHVEGKMELELDNQSTHINLPANKYRQGAPYELTTNIPKVVKDFIDAFHNNDDRERMELLNAYFHGIKYVITGTILLPYSHQIYSSYMNNIIHDIIVGKANISNDPDNVRMINQLKQYDYLKVYDVIFSPAAELDVTYVDLFETYRDYGAVPLETRKLIHAIVKLVFPVDNFSYGDIPNVN